MCVSVCVCLCACFCVCVCASADEAPVAKRRHPHVALARPTMHAANPGNSIFTTGLAGVSVSGHASMSVSAEFTSALQLTSAASMAWACATGGIHFLIKLIHYLRVCLHVLCLLFSRSCAGRACSLLRAPLISALSCGCQSNTLYSIPLTKRPIMTCARTTARVHTHTQRLYVCI